MPLAICIAIVGAESTGKSTLARELGAALAGEGRRVALVPEALREWCDGAGRTPQAHEQSRILELQHERIDAAAAMHEIVVCDTTALMTAVYSRLVFADHTLEQRAAALHRGVSTTLLMALDLPWMADGLQRDGEPMREPVDAALRELLARHGFGYSIVIGQGPMRLAQARAALRTLLPPSTLQLEARDSTSGLFTRLAAGHGERPSRGWACECCVPEAESALLAMRR